MSREHVECIEAPLVAKEEITDSLFAGGSRRLLSNDDETGAYTALCSFPLGWSTDLHASDRPVEIFVLEGRLELDDSRLGPGWYAYVPAHSGRLVASKHTHALVMVEPQTDEDDDRPLMIIDQTTRPWERAKTTAPENQGPQGIVIKLLRVDPRNGEWTWLVTLAPGFFCSRVEAHPVVEECFMLRGDIVNGERGVMRPGSYLWRPPMIEHGPFYSHAGALLFARSKGGSLSTTFSDFPGWEMAIERYSAMSPIFTGSLD